MPNNQTDPIARRGLMLVLSSPSGAGKSTICRNLLAKEQSLSMSVSVTTRQKRGSEIDGTHYHFISVDDFRRRAESDALLEHAEVHGNYYGTPREPVEEAMQAGRDTLFDIDYQGGLQLMQKAPGDVVSIFILPPSMEELRSRLHRRAEDTEAVIEQRLANSKLEMKHWSAYDYHVVNDDLDEAFNKVRSILTAERLRKERRPGLSGFVNGLISSNGK